MNSKQILLVLVHPVCPFSGSALCSSVKKALSKTYEKIHSLHLLGLLALLPFPGLSSYLMHILILVIMWSVIGMAWNLLVGLLRPGLLRPRRVLRDRGLHRGDALQQARHLGLVGLPASVIVVSCFALVIGYICLRLRGPFFALATLAIGVILRIVAENLTDVTGGDLGIMIRERTWVEKTWYYYIILAIAALTFIVVRKVVGSKLGYYFVAIREDQDAAESLGIDTTLYKTIALVLSAVLTGFAGAFYMNYMGYIDPKVVFALHDISIVAIMVVMVGGVATEWGPVVGAIIMVLLAEIIRSIPVLGTAHHTFFGILLIVIIIFLPNGIVGDFEKLRGMLGLARRKP